jgi:hypothetical protein
MSDDELFALANALPLVGWLALCLAPLARPALVASARVAAAAMAVGYAVLVGVALAKGGGPAPDLTTLSGLARAFSDPHVMLVGWVHYLALDLWTGAWEAEDAGRRGVPHWLLLPCLALTFLAGPIGLLLFLGVRALPGRRVPARP